MIAIVGAGVAGLSAAGALRELGYGEALRVFGGESAMPYERPALSKQFLVDRQLAEPPVLRSSAALAEDDVTLELGTEIVAVDPSRRTISTASGRSIDYTALLLATGAQPRRLELPGMELDGIHYLRELHDARALRAALTPGDAVVILGGGVIGLEVAASAAACGAVVTVIEAGPHVMGRILPRELAVLLEEEHRTRGVTIRTAARPLAFEGQAGRVRGVALACDEVVRAETVVVGVGAVPRDGLAADAGLAVDDGILVDDRLRTSDARIFAAGDVARVWHAAEGRYVRLEQWIPAEAEGRHAAASMMGVETPYCDVPRMWSDQHDLHLQAAGFGFSGAEIVCRGDLRERAGVVSFGIRDGRLVAACGFSVGTGAAKVIRTAQTLIERRVPLGADQLADADLDLRRLARASAS